MTDAMPEDSVVECLRCLFGEIALGAKDSESCEIGPNDGEQVCGIDEGYSSSSSQDSESNEPIANPSSDDDENSDFGRIVLRGPTLLRDERIRATPYKYSVVTAGFDEPQSLVFDPTVFIRVPRTPSETDPSTSGPTYTPQSQTPSPNVSPRYAQFDSPLSVISSGSPPDVGYLSYVKGTQSISSDETRLDSASSVFLSPGQSDAGEVVADDGHSPCIEQLSLDGSAVDVSDIEALPPGLFEQIHEVLGNSNLEDDVLDLVPVKQTNEPSLAVASLSVAVVAAEVNVNPVSNTPKVVLPEPIEQLNVCQKNEVRILPKTGATPVLSASPVSPPPPLLRRNSHLSGGGVSTCGPEGRALHDCCTLKDLNEAQVKVSYLNTTKTIHTRDKFGKTFLHDAVAKGQNAIVYWLVKKYLRDPTKWIDINVRDKSQSTPLHYACMGGNPLFVGFLCESGAAVNAVTETGDSPLYLAAERGYTQAVQKLLKVPEIEVNLSNRKGRTALHAAVMSHNRVMVTQSDVRQRSRIDCRDVVLNLLHRDANVAEQDIAGETAIHYAVFTEKFDLLELMTKYGSNAALAARNKFGNTALHMACAMASRGCSQELQEKFVKHLVTSSAPVDIRNAEGRLPEDLVPPGRTSVLRWLR